MRLEIRAKWPSVKGLGFRKTLQQSNQRVSLFFITTDSSINVKLHAPRQQFESLGFDTKIVEKFGAKVKEILNGALLHGSAGAWCAVQRKEERAKQG